MLLLLVASSRRLVLAALTALVLAGCADATTPLAVHGLGAQDRVGPLNLAAPTPAGPVALGSACSRPGSSLSGSEIVAGFCVAAEDAGAAARTFQTYTKTNPLTGEVYAGRTSGFGTPLENIARRDASHAYNSEGFGPAQLDQTSSSYAAVRGREQQLIDYYREQGISGNGINGVGPRNPNGPGYASAANQAFGPFP